MDPAAVSFGIISGENITFSFITPVICGKIIESSGTAVRQSLIAAYRRVCSAVWIDIYIICMGAFEICKANGIAFKREMEIFIG